MRTQDTQNPFWVGVGRTTPPCKKELLLRKLQKKSSTPNPRADSSLSGGRMITHGESLSEAMGARRSLLGPKYNTRIGTWNVRTMWEASKLVPITPITIELWVHVDVDRWTTMERGWLISVLTTNGLLEEPKTTHKLAWSLPDGKTSHQIDHVIIIMTAWCDHQTAKMFASVVVLTSSVTTIRYEQSLNWHCASSPNPARSGNTYIFQN